MLFGRFCIRQILGITSYLFIIIIIIIVTKRCSVISLTARTAHRNNKYRKRNDDALSERGRSYQDSCMRANSTVFRWRMNVGSEGHDVTASGKLFHVRAAATVVLLVVCAFWPCKVINFCSCRKPLYDFLLVINCDLSFSLPYSIIQCYEVQTTHPPIHHSLRPQSRRFLSYFIVKVILL